MSNNTNLVSIGERIAIQRKAVGLTQKELAEKLHTSREIINYWEKGSRDIKTENIILLAKHLFVSTDYLLGLSDNPTTDEATKSLCKTLRLSDKAIKFLQEPKNKSISDTIDKLIEQHLIYEKLGIQFIKGDVWRAKLSFNSILREIMLYFDLCRVENDVIISLNKQGEISIVSDDETKVNATTKKGKIIFDTNENNELLHIVRFKEIALEERLDKLKSAMRKTGRNIDSLDKSYQVEVERLSKIAKEIK